MIVCKTKGGSSIQKKPRVYFTCHPEDFDLFFNKISIELWDIIDCAIYYNLDQHYEDIETDLSNINLFIVPITTKLLTSECRTMNIDIPFALKRNRRILPLMEEDGLEELYTNSF